MRIAPLFLLVSACSYHLFSPPARMAILDSATSVGKGRTMLRGEVAASSALFDADGLSAQAEVRHGVTDDVDLVAGGTAAAFDPEGSDLGQLYMAHAGVRYQIVHSAVAVALTVGGGAAHGPPAGTAIAFDGGLVASFEGARCAVVPFASLGGFVSTPIVSRSVYLGNDEDGDHWGEAKTTDGVLLGLGAKFPVARDRCRAGGLSPAVVVGMSYTYLDDGAATEEFLSGTVGFDIPL